MISVKEFAFENKVSESIVYRHIRNHKDELGEWVQKAHGRTWLTDEGVNFIKNLMTQQTIVKEKANDVVRTLESELKIRNASIEAQKDIIKSLELKLADFEEKKKLLAESNNKIAALEAKNGDLSRDIDNEKVEHQKTKDEAQRLSERLSKIEGSLWFKLFGGKLKK